MQNASAEEAYTQTFTFPVEINSFYAVDLETLNVTHKPLTITLSANEGILLFPSKDLYGAEKRKKEYVFRFAQAPVSFSENAMPVDQVFYSTDGETFEGPVYCEELFQDLLRKRYEGKLTLRYHFTVESVTGAMELLVEDRGEATFNGHVLIFDAQFPDHRKADISNLVKLGDNVYETTFYWHQSDRIYEILFEESETSGFRNAMTYDTELEGIWLSGDFGVYSTAPMEDVGLDYVRGKTFMIGKRPETITEPVTDGMPFFRGKFTITQGD